jgi:hypothetical protein
VEYTHKVCAHNTNTTYDDEDEIEAPSNIRKRGGGSLQIHKIGQCDGGHAKTHTLGADVVGEEFRVEDYASDVDAHTIDGEEEVEPVMY